MFQPKNRHEHAPSSYEWFEQQEGRASERSRKLTFLVLFKRDGRPGYWLVAVALMAAVVAGVGLGSG